MNIQKWVTEKFQHPLSLLFFIFGFILIILGLISSLQIPQVGQITPVENLRYISIALGIIFLIVSILLYYNPYKLREGIHKPGDEARDLKIINATYGIEGNKKDVTGIISAIVEAAVTGCVYLYVHNDNLGGDPIKGTRKNPSHLTL